MQDAEPTNCTCPQLRGAGKADSSATFLGLIFIWRIDDIGIAA